jgi:hypothetical protein
MKRVRTSESKRRSEEDRRGEQSERGGKEHACRILPFVDERMVCRGDRVGVGTEEDRGLSGEGRAVMSGVGGRKRGERKGELM